MDQFTVSKEVPLRPDPDPKSQPVVMLFPGNRVENPVTLGDWSKVEATDAAGTRKAGWILSEFLQPAVGQTVKLHPEPLSAQFEVVTGTIEQLLELANWRKVRVTTGAAPRDGWIDSDATGRTGTTATGTKGTGTAGPATTGTGTGMPPAPVAVTGDTLSLGVNEVFRTALLRAQSITKIDAAALAALIDAEAAKVTSGPDRGRWDPKSFNPSSGAAGMTQFLSGTWIGHARIKTTLLNQTAKSKGLVTALDAVVDGQEAALLALRFDPELSIVSAAEYGVINLRTLVGAGLVSESVSDDDKARYMYLAHHEGAAGAKAFLTRQNSNDLGKFAAQVGAQRAGELTAAAGGDVAAAYRRWLDDYIDQHIQPAKFRTRGTGPTVIVSEKGTLAKFDGAALPIALLGGQQDLIREMQEALARLGYLDPPADGQWGRISNWALTEFCKTNGLSLAEGFTPQIAKTLINPLKTLPDVGPRGDWFDKVIAYMNRKGYWICRHPLATNIVYLEGLDQDGTLNDDRPNVFNDLRLVFTIAASGKPEFQCWEGTTEPGTFWTMNPMNPGGAARIAFDQYKAWIVSTHMPDTPSAHEALVQVGDITVHRDLNKDFKRTNDKADTGLFGVNQHWGYDAPKDDIANTSAGCLIGRTRAGHREFMALLKADPRFKANSGYRFMSAILPADDVMA